MGFAQFTEVYAYGFRGRELESIGVSPVCKFIETLLEENWPVTVAMLINLKSPSSTMVRKMEK